MIYPALSIVAPNASKILTGQKTLEIRTWRPNTLPLKNLVIVENLNFLSQNFKEETGLAIALVDIDAIHAWTEDELEQACGSYWESGFMAWEISNVRPFKHPIATTAKRKIYAVELDI